MKNLRLAFLSAALAATALACSSASDPAPSAVTGTVVPAGFQATPETVVATDEAGAQTTAALASDGSFTLTLPSNHVYTLAVTGGGKSEPVGFPRADGRLDANFRLAAAGAALSLGFIEDASPKPSTKLLLGVPTTTTPVDATVTCPSHERGRGHHGGGDMAGGCPNMGSSTTPVVQTEAELDPTALHAIPSLNAPNDVTCAN